MKFDYITSLAWLDHNLLPIGLTLLAVFIILFINFNKLRNGFRAYRTTKRMDNIGFVQQKNLICPDNLDGYFTIDRLILLHDSILLINFKRYSGNIYCADNIAEWTQLLGQKSFKFPNPIFELNNQISTIQGLISNLPIHGYLFFGHDAEFPKGHPDSVLHLNNIPQQYTRGNLPPLKIEALNAWENLLHLIQQAEPEVPMHLKT